MEQNFYEKLLVRKLNNWEVKFIQHDFLSDKAIQGTFDLIISNPPYISQDDYDNLEPTIKHHEPKHALTDFNDGLTFYKAFANKAKKLLQPKGVMLLEIGLEITKNEISKIFLNKGYVLRWHKDYNDNYRVLELHNE